MSENKAVIRLATFMILALLPFVSVSPAAASRGFAQTSGTFEFQLGPAAVVDGLLAIPVEGQIADLGGGPWTGSVSGSLTFTKGARLCDYVGEWTITRQNAAPLRERVKGALTGCTGVAVGEPHLFGSSRAHGQDSGKIIGFRTFDGGITASFDTFAGTWSGRSRTN
jgi:hypothetical protein